MTGGLLPRQMSGGGGRVGWGLARPKLVSEDLGAKLSCFGFLLGSVACQRYKRWWTLLAWDAPLSW